MKKNVFIVGCMTLFSLSTRTADKDLEAAYSSPGPPSSFLRVEIPHTLSEPLEIPPPPSPPRLHAVARVSNFETLELDASDAHASEEERLAEFVLHTYFYQRRVNRQRVLPYLRHRIRQASDSPVSSEREGIHALRRLVGGERIAEGRELLSLQDLVLNATTEALQSVEEESIHQGAEVKRRVTKKKAICGAAVSSIVTAILGVAATLVVHFTQGNCSS